MKQISKYIIEKLRIDKNCEDSDVLTEVLNYLNEVKFWNREDDFITMQEEVDKEHHVVICFPADLDFPKGLYESIAEKILKRCKQKHIFVDYYEIDTERSQITFVF